MERNVKIAKELVRLAKSLVAGAAYNHTWLGDEHHCVDSKPLHEAFDCYESAIRWAYEENKYTLDSVVTQLRKKGFDASVFGACYILEHDLDAYEKKEAMDIIYQDYKMCGNDTEGQASENDAITDFYQRNGKIFWAYVAIGTPPNHFKRLLKESEVTRITNKNNEDDYPVDDDESISPPLKRRLKRRPFLPY